MKDPVCGMEVPDHSGVCMNFKDQHICFCSKGCMETFEENPQQFLGRKGGEMRMPWEEEELEGD